MTRLPASHLFRPETEIRCLCGEVMRVRTIEHTGQHESGPILSGERGSASAERTCPACWASLKVEVWV